MTHLLTVGCWAVVLIATQAAREEGSNETPSCGQAACYLLLSQLGKGVPIDRLEQLSGETSFAMLSETLNAHGVSKSRSY